MASAGRRPGRSPGVRHAYQDDGQHAQDRWSCRAPTPGGASPGGARWRRRAGRAEPGGRPGGSSSPPSARRSPACPVTFRWKLRGSSVDAPHRLVDQSQLVDRERRRAEGRGERRVLELGPGPLDAVGEDPTVVEGEPATVVEQRVDGVPRRRGRVGAGHRVAGRSVTSARWATDRTGPRGSRSGAPYDRELLEVDAAGRAIPVSSTQLALGRVDEVLLREDEATGQRQPALVRRDPPPHEQHLQHGRHGRSGRRGRPRPRTDREPGLSP